ncbi:MAG: hypothetical protein ACRDKK_05580, partial [Gaiellaceae bacterium]
GAFMKSIDDARKLAEAMAQLGERANRQVIALLTDMDQPLGWAIGNALEVEEARQTLAGAEAPTDLFSLTVQAAGRLVSLSDLGVDEQEGMRRAERSIEDGSALEAYERWIKAQGGDPSLDVLPRAPIVRDVTAEGEGYVTEVSAIGLGRAALELGAGRRTKDDVIDHAVGIRCFAKRGDSVTPGQLLAELHVRDEDAADWAAGQVQEHIVLSAEPSPLRSIVLETIG